MTKPCRRSGPSRPSRQGPSEISIPSSKAPSLSVHFPRRRAKWIRPPRTKTGSTNYETRGVISSRVNGNEKVESPDTISNRIRRMGRASERHIHCRPLRRPPTMRCQPVRQPTRSIMFATSSVFHRGERGPLRFGTLQRLNCPAALWPLSLKARYIRFKTKGVAPQTDDALNSYTLANTDLRTKPYW